jgi:hypothetical protein
MTDASVTEYRRRAVECEALAEKALSVEHRQKILQIARSWRDLADQREAMLRARSRLQSN